MKLFEPERKSFPSPKLAGPEGVVQVSNDISVERLMEAYSFGIFPWPVEGYPILWFCPEERGIIDFEDLHIPRSLAKWIRQNNLQFTWNKNFSKVIEICQSTKRPKQSGTWITPLLKAVYLEFHKAGYAHSLECWRDGEMIGGMYGVYVAGVFCGESMFFREPNASKACLVHLIQFLQENGLAWIDTQMVTPVVEQLGGRNILRQEFLQRLAKAKQKAKPIKFI